MPDVEPGATVDPVDEVSAFVDELAEQVKAPWVRAACAQIRSRTAAGVVSIGLHRLLREATTQGSTADPVPRRASEELSGVAAAIADHPLIVLESAGPVATAAELAALLRDGRRVLVTAADRAELAEVQSAVPPELAPLCVRAPVALSPGELRQLRALRATGTDRRRARLLQTLPFADELPDPELVTRLCRKAGRGRPHTGTDVIPELLDAMEPDDRQAVIELARQTRRYLDEFAGGPDSEWMWALLTRVVFHRDEQEFEQLVENASRAAAVVALPRVGGMGVDVTGEIPPAAAPLLTAYLEFLDGGGRSRGLRRSPEQRAAEPILRQITINGAVVSSSDGVRQVLEFVQLNDRFERIVAACERLDVPPPATVGDTAELAKRLEHLAAAAGSVVALRHAVLFIHPESPVAVPDLPTAHEVAGAIIAYGGITEIVQAERDLHALADQVAVLVPPQLRSAEHELVVDALEACDDVGYVQALDELAGARREVMDESRCNELLDRLEEASPELAQAWDEPDGEPLPSGYAWLTPASDLLAQLPGPDSADVVLVLGADSMGLEQLLVAAAAPRLVAVTTGVTSLTAAPAESPPTVLSVLRKVPVPVVWAGRTKESAAVRRRRVNRAPAGKSGSAITSEPWRQAGA